MRDIRFVAVTIQFRFGDIDSVGDFPPSWILATPRSSNHVRRIAGKESSGWRDGGVVVRRIDRESRGSLGTSAELASFPTNESRRSTDLGGERLRRDGVATARRISAALRQFVG